MAGKVIKKSKILVKSAKSLSQKSAGSTKKTLAIAVASVKAKSKVVSSSLKKAAAQAAKGLAKSKSAKKSSPLKPVVSQKQDSKIMPTSAKAVKAQPEIGKAKLKQVAKKLAAAAEVKAQKKKEMTQKVADAKEKVKDLKAKRTKEEVRVIEKKIKKTPTPESIFDEAGKVPTPDVGVAPVLTDAEGRPYCKVKDCDQIANIDGYCRYHYLLLWKKIQVRRKILIDGKLERYVEELTARYPDKFLDVIRKDLLNEKNFQAAIAELEIDDSGNDSEFEEEDTQSIEEVRTFSESSLIGDDDF